MKFGMLLAVAAGALVFTAPVSAAVVFDLDNVKLVDGGTLTGSLTLSDDLSTLVDFSITSSSNHNWPYGNFVARTYTFADATSFTWNTTQGLWSQFGSPLAQVRVYLGQSLGLSGAALSQTAGEWQIGAGDRYATSGSLIPHQAAAVPEPAAWAMLIAGFGLVGASLRRRSRTPLLSN